METFANIRFGIKIMEALACIAGFAVWARLRPGFWKSFPFYLLVIVCCEFAGWYMNKNGIYKPAKYMYSFFVVPLEFLYMYFLFYQNLGRRYKTTVLVLAALYVLALLTEYFLVNKEKWLWMSISYATGCIGLFVLITVYFLKMANEKATDPFTKDIFFWVCLGLVIFYVGTLPYFTMPRGLYDTNPDLYMALSWAFVLLNYVMYTLFIIGFLCYRPKMS